jgi:hypothetical protein
LRSSVLRPRRLAQDLADLGFELVVGAAGLVSGVARDVGASRATTPILTIAVAAHSSSEATRKPARACSWRARNHAIVTHDPGLARGNDAEGDVRVQASFEPPGGAHADAVAIEEHAEQVLGVVGGWPCLSSRWAR